ncbi:MAG: PIN domain-containing protein [Lamprobacter sp.]|uniref:type II toxin-antitoxin system VapC family toxin n=1 Tax=Lamprobacter sp. TaxID=3100796 RepID=UPI002B261515|nr:PIN domain-containing protein [Lamprobacter sp.]MEA3642664.1 PIN domain-containing protein [Lamprobacter sp.]
MLVDAGPLIALFNANDAHHTRCLRWIKGNTDRLITTSGVLTEASHVLDRRVGIQAAIDCLSWVDAALLVHETASHLKGTIDVMQRYQDLPADYVDAELVALANRLGVFRVATLDSDFTVYRGAGRQPFHCVIH